MPGEDSLARPARRFGDEKTIRARRARF